jgi:CHASE3 domain sensor protein
MGTMTWEASPSMADQKEEILERVDKLQLAAAGQEAEETLRKVINYVDWHLNLIDKSDDLATIKNHVRNTLMVLNAVEKRLSPATAKN